METFKIIERMREEYGATITDVKKALGMNSNGEFQRLPWIRDEEARKREIKRLEETRGKSYAERLYLMFLTGKISDEKYGYALSDFEREAPRWVDLPGNFHGIRSETG